jgi:hypothetical protein
MKYVSLLASALFAFCTSVFAQTQLITNGGFEVGTNGWTITSLGNGGSIVTGPSTSNSGSNHLQLVASPTSIATQEAFQAITIPSNAVSVTLTFFANVYSVDSTASETSLLTVSIGNAAGSLLANIFSVDNTFSDNTYHMVQLDLTRYKTNTAGQLQVQFWVQDFTSAGTYYNIDDVSVTSLSLADQGANDYFTNRTTLVGTNLSLLATNTYATKESGEPNHAGNPGGHSLWWSWTAPADGTVTINTDGSDFNTLLAVYTGSVVSNLVKIAANDDENSRSFNSAVSFQAVAGTQYQIAVDGKNGASGTIVLNLKFLADTKGPNIAIQSPAPNAKVTNSTVTVKGTASDPSGVTMIQCRLENANGTNDYQSATGTTKWSIVFTNVAPGPNTVRVLAYDNAGNVSKAVTRTFDYVILIPLTLNTSGDGTVSPKVGGHLLELNKLYTLLAHPTASTVFSNWIDGSNNVLGTSSKLTFAMQSNMVINANFVPNPFLPAKGNYGGLFYDTNGIEFTNAGYFSAVVGTKGSFSAVLQLAGTRRAFSGQFSAGGVFSNSLVHKGQSPVWIQLQLDLNGGDLITGSISNDAWTAELAANRAVFSKSSPAPQASKKYTLMVSPGDPNLFQPAGYGAGALSVDPLGNISFAGTLGDGTKVTQRTFISKQGQWPLFLSLYANKGLMLGWLTFTNSPDNSPVGAVAWIKLPQITAKFYPEGFDFTNTLASIGSLYTFTKGTPVLTLTNSGTGTVVLQNGDLSQPITNSFSLDSNNKVTSPDKLTLSIVTSSGLFHGTVVNPATGKPVPVNGALLQNENAGFGSFLGNSHTGSVTVGD